MLLKNILLLHFTFSNEIKGFNLRGCNKTEKYFLETTIILQVCQTRCLKEEDLLLL